MLTTTRYKTANCDAGETLVDGSAVPRQRIDGELYTTPLTCLANQKPDEPWAYTLGMKREGRRRFKANRVDRDPYGYVAQCLCRAEVHPVQD